ncbi:MAG: SDR family NAD(P)-dependent oxidoreductase, partial [Rhodoblastus sp.]|nr:SDR family NAD(P)-dependent oxidoreductase [Rhodoblastus sp.]
MNYFITGASGFIGKRFVRKLLTRKDARVFVLMREASEEKLARLREFCGDSDKRIVAVQGDITAEKLGVDAKDVRKLKGKIDHFVHLAAIYDLTADPSDVERANIGGVRNALDFSR